MSWLSVDIPEDADRVEFGIRPDGVYAYADVLDVSGNLVESHEYDVKAAVEGLDE